MILLGIADLRPFPEYNDGKGTLIIYDPEKERRTKYKHELNNWIEIKAELEDASLSNIIRIMKLLNENWRAPIHTVVVLF